VDYCYNPDIELDSDNSDLDTAFLGGPMGHSKVDKAKTHQRIVAIASRRFREKVPAQPVAATPSDINLFSKGGVYDI
jgi:hypothetical protein